MPDPPARTIPLITCCIYCLLLRGQVSCPAAALPAQYLWFKVLRTLIFLSGALASKLGTRLMVNGSYSQKHMPIRMRVSSDSALPFILRIGQQVLPRQFYRTFQLFRRISCIVRILWVMYLMANNLRLTYLF